MKPEGATTRREVPRRSGTPQASSPVNGGSGARQPQGQLRDRVSLSQSASKAMKQASESVVNGGSTASPEHPYAEDFEKALEDTGLPAEWNDDPALRELLNGEGGGQFPAPDAQNPNSTAFGIFQMVKPTWDGLQQTSPIQDIPELAAVGHGSTDPYVQAAYGFSYIADRYGDPSRALAFRQATVAGDPSLAPEDLRERAQVWVDHGWKGY